LKFSHSISPKNQPLGHDSLKPSGFLGNLAQLVQDSQTPRGVTPVPATPRVAVPASPRVAVPASPRVVPPPRNRDWGKEAAVQRLGNGDFYGENIWEIM